VGLWCEAYMNHAEPRDANCVGVFVGDAGRPAQGMFMVSRGQPSLFTSQVILMRAFRDVAVGEARRRQLCERGFLGACVTCKELVNSYCPPSASFAVRKAILRPEPQSRFQKSNC
jgi:hypothetical protein